MLRSATLSACLLAIALTAAPAAVRAQESTNQIDGFKDTPMQPGGKWHVHDPDRPQPPIVKPGTFSTPDQPGRPPADAIVLFNGGDLSAWRDKDGKPTQWTVQNGAMVGGKGDIVTRQEFGDIQLHVEFAEPTPPSGNGQGRGNSGIFLMGRYELQVLDGYRNLTYADGSAGALYGQHPPLANACLPPGQWQVYDIIFNAPKFGADGKVISPACLTAFQNGIVVQNHQAFRGATDWRIVGAYSPHAPLGPISLQDHHNPVRYRNIWVRPLPAADEP